VPALPVERKLAAIFAADIAGYSRLMGEEEEGTHAAVIELRHEVIAPRIDEHRGRIVKLTGDGFLAEFASVVDAVRCAVEIQLGMAGRNEGAPFARGWQWSAWLRLWAGEPDLAIEHFQTSLRLNPREQRANPFMGIGVANFFARRLETARATLLRSLQERPNWVPTYRDSFRPVTRTWVVLTRRGKSSGSCATSRT
jgi:hypothetical protein